MVPRLRARSPSEAKALPNRSFEFFVRTTHVVQVADCLAAVEASEDVNNGVWNMWRNDGCMVRHVVGR